MEQSRAKEKKKEREEVKAGFGIDRGGRVLVQFSCLLFKFGGLEDEISSSHLDFQTINSNKNNTLPFS